jgi:hypothetical protein
MKVLLNLSRVSMLALMLALVVGLNPVIPVFAGTVSPNQDAASGLQTGPTTDPHAQPADAAVSDDWWAEAQEYIRASEYHVTWQETTYLDDVPEAYQAPNRAQNLRTYFTPEGPVIIPRTWSVETAVPPWRLDVRLAAWGREGALQPVSPATLEVEENRIEYRRGELTESYRNDERGLEQAFVLKSRPEGGQPGTPLQLELAFGGDLLPEMVHDGVETEFRTPGGDGGLRYGGLQVVDAAGKVLPAWLSLQGSMFSILIDDAEATYPIQVDPAITGLPPDHQWSITFGTSGAMFATSVATAGDVDGDGYSEVIVGAPDYDAGAGEEGAVFLYYGYAGGLYEWSDWFEVFDQAGAHYGRSAATAGDVNGDGYADVIAGAPDYTNGESGEGGIWVYYGADDGLQHDGYDHKESNRAGAQFGYSVGTAGDVNGEEEGDYFSDVIIGAPGYTMGDTNEGRVYVWQGSDDGLLTGHSWYAEANRFNTQLGHSVATAGDVNGDGYADVVVGAVGYALSPPAPESRGAAYVWHGSEDGVNGGDPGTLDNYEWREIGDVVHLEMGFSVGTAGDVDGDGYSDVIVGGPCPSPDSPCTAPYDGGQAKLYLGSVLGLEDSVANTDYADHAGASFGWSVGTAGDVNGDGYADVVVGSPHYTDGESEEGRAYVWYGQPSSSGISGYRDWDNEGNQVDAYYGASVATAGDVNGDGYSDIIVGAPGDASSAGTAYVYHGGPDKLSETAGWTKPSNQEDALYGSSVGTAGDVNGDGYADVIVGAPRWGVDMAGGAWVYHGAANGLETGPSWYKPSNQAGSEFGISVGTAGDVNGDGYDDVIVGAPHWTEGKEDEGGAWVYLGSSTGVDTVPAWYKFSNQTGSKFGASVGTAGDVNGDGYADIIVGAPFWQSGGDERGGAWIYHGTENEPHSAPDRYLLGDQPDAEFGRAVGTAGDVNADGYSDIIVGAPMWDDGSPANEGRAWVYHGSRGGVRETYSWRQRGTYFNAQYGHAVGTAGDVNGDGYSDIIVGAPNWYDNLENEGKVWVYRGSGAGLDFTSSWSKEGGQNGAHYGWSVGTAGDVNGDGYADIIIGIEGWNGGHTNEGGASLYYGSYGGLEDSRAWHAECDQISAHYGYSVGTAGDVNGDGYAEVIVGAPNYQRATELHDEGQAFLYYGNGSRGVSLNPRQQHPGGAPLAHLGRSSDMGSFRARLRAGTPFGRARILLECEVKPVGTPFTGSDAQAWGNYQLSVPGHDKYIVPHDLAADTPHHWRVRWRYDPVTTPWMPAGRWVTMPWNGWNETDFRTGGDRALLPVVLREYLP